MALKACTVVVHDLNQTAHTIDVTAESLYEAIAQALATLRGHNWVGDIGKGLTTVTVKAGGPAFRVRCEGRGSSLVTERQR